MYASVIAVHAIFLLAVAMIMAGFQWAMLYAVWAFDLLHTLTHHM